ncbi:hypothetical protein EON83_20130 [bacterium]|nr:MAG: hypothetical protein EON83_20130 [bacterium]
MRKSFLSTACALVVGALLGAFSAPSQAAPTAPTNLQLVDQLIATSKDGKTAQQGDMVLSVPTLRAFRSSIAGGGRTTRSAFYRTTYWTVVGGKVPYTLAADLPQAQQDAFVQACREWEKWANLKFSPRTNETNYINVIAGGDSSNSAVGMTGGEQTMRLATWATSWTACHELAHALGVMHEQSRSDRDNYVEIKFDNVQADLAFNYAIITNSDNHGEYDFDSIMHYGPWGFAIDSTKPTMVCRPPYERFQTIIGQSDHLTELDKAGMADIYGFPPGITATPKPTPTLPPRPTLACNPVTVTEGNSGTTPMIFRVGLTYAPRQDVSFSYKIVRYIPGGMNEESADLDKYSAIPGVDYSVDSMEGTITMPAATGDNNGNTTREFEIPVSVIGDTDVENDESLMLVLSDPVNVRFANDATTLSVKGTIANDDIAATPTARPTATTKPQPTSTPAPPSSPIARVSLSPTAPSPTGAVIANISLWPSGAQTTSQNVWRVKGSIVARNVGTLDLSAYRGLKRGDKIKIEVTPYRSTTVGTIVGEVATAEIEVGNTAPVTREVLLSSLSYVPVSAALTGTDIDGDALTFALATKPTNGSATVALVADKWTLTYRSKVGFVGTETFTIVANDGKLKSAPATVRVTVGANSKPQLVSVTPDTGTFTTGKSFYFKQVVKDADKNLSSIAFLIGNSSRSASVSSGFGLVYDMPTRTLRLSSDDGTTLSDAFRSGQLIENSRASVVLRSAALEADGTLTFMWQFTPKAGWTGAKTLWGRADDAGGLVDGWRSIGSVTFVDPAGSSTKSTSSSFALSAKSS